MAQERFEHAFNRDTGASHLTGKRKGKKNEAIHKKMESMKTMAGKVFRIHKGK